MRQQDRFPEMVLGMFLFVVMLITTVSQPIP